MAKSRAQQAAIAVSMKKAGKKPKMQTGGSKKSVMDKPKLVKPTSSKSMKNVRWEGGNTGFSVPSYMVNEIGTPLPQYKAIIKAKLKKAGKLSPND